MSKRHPVVAVTGSSGAGTSTVKRAFEAIFAREGIMPAVVEGDSYHRYERGPMKEAMATALAKGENFSHFGPEANLFDKLYYTNGSSFNVRPGTPLSFRASVRVTY
jgi:phosphoribulokinase